VPSLRRERKNKMIEGMLFIEEDGQLSIVFRGNPPKRLAMIEPGTKIEIRLGNAWIEGTFRPDFEDGIPCEPYTLACEPGTSFCGLQSGMTARMNKE
jgi:hypothetical protein